MLYGSGMRTAVLATTVGLVVLGTAPANAAYRTFQTPSKQIRCASIAVPEAPAQIRCDLAFLNDRAVVLTHRGKARRIRITDTVADPGARILRYGTTTRFGDFRCTSRRTGLTCTSRRSKHGFTVSRQSQKLF